MQKKKYGSIWFFHKCFYFIDDAWFIQLKCILVYYYSTKVLREKLISDIWFFTIIHANLKMLFWEKKY